jgi:hypothetical protein
MKRNDETKTPIGDIRLDVPRGVYKNMSFVNKFGVLPSMDSADAATDVWEHGALQRDYIYDAWGTAPIERIISTGAGDGAITIRITGLDIEGNEVEQDAILNDAFADTILATPLWRIFRMVNISANPATGFGKDITGTVSAFIGDTHVSGVPPANTVRAQILNGNNQTQMALYTVPKGKTAYFGAADAGLAKGGGSAATAVVALFARQWPTVFTVQKTISLVSTGSSNFQAPLSVFLVAEPLTDIKIRVMSVSANAIGIWGGFQIYLVDEIEEAK